MSTTVAELLEQVLRLPEDSREELLAQIDERCPPPQAFVQEQMAKICDRMKSVREGRSKLIPAQEAHRLVRQSFKKF